MCSASCGCCFSLHLPLSVLGNRGAGWRCWALNVHQSLQPGGDQCHIHLWTVILCPGVRGAEKLSISFPCTSKTMSSP